MASPEQMFDRRFINPIQQIVDSVTERANQTCTTEGCDYPVSGKFEGEPYCSDCLKEQRMYDRLSDDAYRGR